MRRGKRSRQRDYSPRRARQLAAHSRRSRQYGLPHGRFRVHTVHLWSKLLCDYFILTSMNWKRSYHGTMRDLQLFLNTFNKNRKEYSQGIGPKVKDIGRHSLWWLTDVYPFFYANFYLSFYPSIAKLSPYLSLMHSYVFGAEFWILWSCFRLAPSFFCPEISSTYIFPFREKIN